MLHSGKGTGQLTDFVGALEVWQPGIELTGSNRLSTLCQLVQRTELAGDDADEDVEHQQQTCTDNSYHGTAHTVEAAKDVFLGTDDSHRATRLAKGFVEDVAVVAVNVHVLHALLAALHGMSQSRHRCVGVLDSLSKDGLTCNLACVRVYNIDAATAYHDAVGMGIGLHIGDGLRKPVQRKAGVDDANLPALLVIDSLAVAGHHLGRVGVCVVIHVWLGPARTFAQHGHQIPVHVEILIVIVAALYGAGAVTVVFRICREVAAFVLEVVRLEGNGAVVEVRVVQQHSLTIDKH